MAPKVLRYAFSNRSITLFPFGTAFEAPYPSLGITLPTGKGQEIHISAETVQVHAGSRFELTERTITINARRFIILPDIQGGASADKVIFDVSGSKGEEWTEAAANGGPGDAGWVKQNYRGFYSSYDKQFPGWGHSGIDGDFGRIGKNGGVFFLTAEISCPDSVTIEIISKGGDGGTGQTGGNGGKGGDGAVSESVPDGVDAAGGHKLIDGAQGGHAGWGGRGGNGGNGGAIRVYNFGSPKHATLDDVMSNGNGSAPIWDGKIDHYNKINLSCDVNPGSPGPLGKGGIPGLGGKGGNWHHLVFIGVHDDTGGKEGEKGFDPQTRLPGRKGKPGSIIVPNWGNTVGLGYADQHRTVQSMYDPLWLAGIVKRVRFELQVILAMTGIDFLDASSIRDRVGELPDTLRWLATFYECWKAPDASPSNISWHYDPATSNIARSVFLDAMDELIDMQSKRSDEVSDMYGNPYNWLPEPNVDMNRLGRAVLDLELISGLANGYNDLLQGTQMDNAKAKALFDQATNTMTTFASKSAAALQEVRNRVAGLDMAERALEAAKKEAMDELEKVFSANSPPLIGKEKALAVAEAIGTVLMFTEPELALSAKTAGSLLNVGLAGINAKEQMSTPTGDYDPRYVRSGVQEVDVDMNTDLEKIANSLTDAVTKAGPMRATVTLDSTKFYSICNKFFTLSSTVHAKQLFNLYIKAGQVFNEKVMDYNRAIFEQTKLSLEYLNAKKLMEQVSQNSERIDADATLMSGLFNLLQAMQQREVLSIFNSSVKALQALNLKPTTIVDKFLGLGSWDKLFLMDPHSQSVASTLPVQVGNEIAAFRKTWNENRPTRTTLKVQLTPELHPYIFNPTWNQHDKDGKTMTSPLQSFKFDMTWEELAKNVSPSFDDLWDIRLRDAWVYLVGAENIDKQKRDILVSLRLGGNFDVSDKPGGVHPFQTNAVEFPSQYSWEMKPDARGNLVYTTVPVSQAANEKLFLTNLGVEAENESFPVQGIVRQWEVSWPEDKIDVSKVTSIIIQMDVDVRSGGKTPKITPGEPIVSQLLQARPILLKKHHKQGQKLIQLAILDSYTPRIIARPLFVNFGMIRHVFRLTKGEYDSGRTFKTLVDFAAQKTFEAGVENVKKSNRDDARRRQMAALTRNKIGKIDLARTWTVRERTDVLHTLHRMEMFSRPKAIGTTVGGARFPWMSGRRQPRSPDDSDEGHSDDDHSDDDHDDNDGNDEDSKDDAYITQSVKSEGATTTLQEPHGAFRDVIECYTQGAQLINPAHTAQLIQMSSQERQAYIIDHAREIFDANNQHASGGSLENCMVVFGNSGGVLIDRILTSTDQNVTVHSMLYTPLGSDLSGVYNISLDSSAPDAVVLSHLGPREQDLSDPVTQRTALLRDAVLTTTFSTLPHLLDMKRAGKTDLEGELKSKQPTLYDARTLLASFDRFSGNAVETIDLIKSGGVDPPRVEVHEVTAANGKSALERLLATRPDDLAKSTPVVSGPAGIDVYGRPLTAVEGLLGATSTSVFSALTDQEQKSVEAKTLSAVRHAIDRPRLDALHNAVSDFLDNGPGRAIADKDKNTYRTPNEQLLDVQQHTDFNVKFEAMVRELITKNVNLSQLQSSLLTSLPISPEAATAVPRAIEDVIWKRHHMENIGANGLVQAYAERYFDKVGPTSVQKQALTDFIKNTDNALKNLKADAKFAKDRWADSTATDLEKVKIEVEMEEILEEIDRLEHAQDLAKETVDRQNDPIEGQKHEKLKERELERKQKDVERKGAERR